MLQKKIRLTAGYLTIVTILGLTQAYAQTSKSPLTPPQFEPPVSVPGEELNPCCPSLVLKVMRADANNQRTAPNGTTINIAMSEFNLTITNTSTKAVVAMKYEWLQTSGFGGSLRFYTQKPILPGERVERFMVGRQAGGGPVQLKAIVFEDGTWEGDPAKAREIVLTLEGSSALSQAESAALREIANAPDDEMASRLAQVEARLSECRAAAQKQIREIPDDPNARDDAMRRNGEIGALSGYTPAVRDAREKALAGDYERARRILRLNTDALDHQFPVKK